MPWLQNNHNGHITWVDDDAPIPTDYTEIEMYSSPSEWGARPLSTESEPAPDSSAWDSLTSTWVSFDEHAHQRSRPRSTLTGMAAGAKKLPTHLYSRDELRRIRDNIFFRTTDNGLRRTVRNMIKLLVQHEIYREDT